MKGLIERATPKYWFLLSLFGISLYYSWQEVSSRSYCEKLSDRPYIYTCVSENYFIDESSLWYSRLIESAIEEIEAGEQLLGISTNFDIHIVVNPFGFYKNYEYDGKVYLIQDYPYNISKFTYVHEFFHVIYEGSLDSVWPVGVDWYISEYAKTNMEEDMAETFAHIIVEGLCNEIAPKEKIKIMVEYAKNLGFCTPDNSSDIF